MRGFFASIIVVILVSSLKAAAPSLNAPVRIGSQFRFTISGESNTAYIVEATTNFQTWLPVATNFDVSAQRTVTLNAQREREYFRARRASPLFRFAVAASGRIELNGHSLYTDSFDSADPNASTNGGYDPNKKRDNGDVVARGGVVNSGDSGRIELIGHAWTREYVPPPVFGPFDKIGSLAWHLNLNTYGIEPGWWVTNNTPDSSPHTPTSPPDGTFSPSDGVWDGEYYDYVLGTVNYQMATLRMSGDQRMLVMGNVRLYVTTELEITGNALIQLASPVSSLTLYVGASSDSYLGGLGIAGAVNATNFTYYGFGNLTLALTNLTGRIYAGGNCLYSLGNSNATATLIGSINANSLTLGSNLRVHFDESLRRVGPFY